MKIDMERSTKRVNDEKLEIFNPTNDVYILDWYINVTIIGQSKLHSAAWWNRSNRREQRLIWSFWTRDKYNDQVLNFNKLKIENKEPVISNISHKHNEFLKIEK